MIPQDMDGFKPHSIYWYMEPHIKKVYFDVPDTDELLQVVLESRRSIVEESKIRAVRKDATP